MKTTITLLFLFLASSFVVPLSTDQFKTKKEDFSWLLGAWKRTNEKEGQQTFEYWKKQDKNRFIGLGCTLKNGDTLWKENIVLHKKDSWRFEVTGQGEDKPTVFILTEVGESSFTCQNPENEFPKVIRYQRSNSGLTAVISGGGPNITFEFKKTN